MSIIYFLLAILALGVIGGIGYIIYWAEALDELDEELSRYSVHLDERANRIAAEEATVRELHRELQDEIMKRREEPPKEKKDVVSERYGVILQAAEEATGWRLTDSRTSENTTIRAFISYHMHNEGFSYETIGKVMHRNHSTVTHLVRKMEDMLSIPQIFEPEISMYNRMKELL